MTARSYESSGTIPAIASPEQHAHAEISRISRNSRHLVVTDSYHEIHLSHPDVVASAIRDVVASVRTKAPIR
jgi:pimeloyl-ACP methyl ester carboxylesterase